MNWDGLASLLACPSARASCCYPQTRVQADGSAAMVVLDGQTLTDVARAQLPAWQLTIGFHGCFIPHAP